MKLTENDKKLFEALNKNEYGKLLCDYVERLCLDLFNADEVTKENIDARKDTVKVLRSEIVDKIRIVTQDKKAKGKNQFI